MAIDKIQSESINLADNFAFTGTVTGAVNASQLAKAWVNFNGTGTVAIKDSFNVSSITDNGTGDYDINFTSAFSNTNYVCTAQTIVGNTVATCEPNSASIADFLSRDINGNSADRDTNQAVFFGS